MIGSLGMYGIFTYVYPLNYPNVGKYSIHGASGIENATFLSGIPWFFRKNSKKSPTTDHDVLGEKHPKTDKKIQSRGRPGIFSCFSNCCGDLQMVENRIHQDLPSGKRSHSDCWNDIPIFNKGITSTQSGAPIFR